MSVTASIYCAGDTFLTSVAIADLQASGFSTVISWAFHVGTTGDITNEGAVVSNGVYAPTFDWSQLALLKQGTTSINRILISIGGSAGSNNDFLNIRTLMNTPVSSGGGFGPGSTLYDNFAALKAAIPAIDGVDFDDESLYDHATTVGFAQMLNALGYEVTFCPYMDPDFWIGCLAVLNANNNNIVTGFNLQCYSGGQFNTPEQWISAIADKMGQDFPADTFVSPGLAMGYEADDPTIVSEMFASWKFSGINSGFGWDYKSIQQEENEYPIAAYSKAIITALE